MPNQRDENKQGVSAWITSELNERIKRLAREKGVARSDIITELLENYADAEDGFVSSTNAAPLADPIATAEAMRRQMSRRQKKVV
jgi:predicted DNA-binding protein